MDVVVVGSTCSSCGARGVGTQPVLSFTDLTVVGPVEPFPVVMDDDLVRWGTAQRCGVIIAIDGNRCGCEAQPLVELESIPAAAS